jgi:hypothetical protein
MKRNRTGKYEEKSYITERENGDKRKGTGLHYRR